MFGESIFTANSKTTDKIYDYADQCNFSFGQTLAVIGTRITADFGTAFMDLGQYGEHLTVKELQAINRLGYSGKTLTDLYVPNSNGIPSQIDLIYLTAKGVFVIESKNFSGTITGTERLQQWNQHLNGKNYTFYNPILQNAGHIRSLMRYLPDSFPVFSLIAFSERCQLKDITLYSDDTFIFNREALWKIVNYIWTTKPDTLDKENLEKLYLQLETLTHTPDFIKNRHMQNAKRVAVSASTCPQCGRELVLRTARKGKNTGHKFYGCSGYPNCKYTKDC